jgi:hypothetical protein
LDIFDEDKADRFPSSRPWDHKIELKEGFEPKYFKTYNLTPEEQKGLDTWIKENLDKGYLHTTIAITHGITFLLRKKERRKAQTLPRLSIPK